MKPGQTVHLSVIRDGTERDYPVALGEQPGDKSESSSQSGDNSADRILDGVSLQTLTPELARDYGVKGVSNGVLVQRVDPDSDAAQAGLERGGVILEVNRHAVTSLEQLNRYVRESSNGSTLLFVNHNGRTRYIVISK
jgi:serine protease Do